MLVYGNLIRLPHEEYAERLARLPIPAFQEYGGPGVDESYDTAVSFFASFADGPEIAVIPMVEVIDDEVRERLEEVVGRGVAAVKFVHDLDLVEQPADVLEADHEALLGRLADAGVPAIIHLDLRRSEGWIRRVLRATPRLRLTIAHLGYSRARMSPILEEFPNVNADIANLAPHMGAKPDSYRDFLDRHAGQVVFGSDAFLGDLSGIEAHAQVVHALGLSDEARDALLDRRAWFFSG